MALLPTKHSVMTYVGPPLAGTGGTQLALDTNMIRGTAVLIALGCLIGLSVQGLAGAPAPAVPASASEYGAVERFLADIEKPPVAYQARRRLEASSAKLKESAWLEAVTEYDPAVGLTYSIVAQGGSERIRRRVLNAVLETERENSTLTEWRKANLSRANYAFDFGGHAGDGMLKMQLTPRRRDSRLVLGVCAADRALGRPRSRRRPLVEVAIVLGALGRGLTQLRARWRRDDAGRRRVDRGRPHRGDVDILDDLRLPDG